MGEVISDPVRLLLSDRLTTFERLAVLLFLHNCAPEELTAEAIAERLGMRSDLVDEAITGLVSCGLIQSAPGGVSWRFDTVTDEMSEAVGALSIAYCEQRAAVVNYMNVNAIGRIRSGPRGDTAFYANDPKLNDDD